MFEVSKTLKKDFLIVVIRSVDYLSIHMVGGGGFNFKHEIRNSSFLYF